MSQQLGICGSCHQERPLAAAGMCSRCYELTRPKITCLDCGQERRPSKHLPEGVVCARCWGRRNAVACGRCGNVKPRANALSADPLCPACWTAARPHITCSSCGRTRPPGGVTSEGEPLCKRCTVRRRAPVTCARCQQLRPPHQRAPGVDGYLCGTCAASNRAGEVCGGCGRTAPVVERANDGSARCARCWAKAHRKACAGCGRLRLPGYRLPDGSPLCRACGRRRGRQQPCGICGRVGWWDTKSEDGSRLCLACWRSQRRPCSRCGTVTLVALRWLAGPVCADCVDAALTAPQACLRCGNNRPNVAAAGQGPCCPACADLRFDYQCAGCGRFTRPLRHGRCARCRLVAEIAAAAPGGVPASLTEFVDEALLSDPVRGVRRFQASAAAPVLRALLAGTSATHQTVDQALQDSGRGATPGAPGPPRVVDHTMAVERLRSDLVAAGVLPPREPALHRYHQRVTELIAAVPSPGQLVVRRYARWAVTRPLQERLLDGATLTAGLTRWPLTRVRVAAQFTAAVIGRGSLAAVTQSVLDAWVSELPSTGRALRAFVQWSAAHGYMARGLEVPWRASREDRRGMNDEDRITLAGRLLRAETADPPARLGAVLILLFGQKSSRLVLLKTGDVSVDEDGRVFLALGQAALRLREPLAQLALQVADTAHAAGSPWLFPGMNGPLSSDRFRERLAAVGLPRVLPARNAALATLASEVPPALLADKLGLSLSAAVMWSKAVGAARADYAGLRMT